MLFTDVDVGTGSVCLIDNVQHLNFPSKITSFYVTRDVVTREIFICCGKILQNVFLLAVHTPMTSRLWTLFNNPDV